MFFWWGQDCPYLKLVACTSVFKVMQLAPVFSKGLSFHLLVLRTPDALTGIFKAHLLHCV